MIYQRFGQGVSNLSTVAELRTFDGNCWYLLLLCPFCHRCLKKICSSDFDFSYFTCFKICQERYTTRHTSMAYCFFPKIIYIDAVLAHFYLIARNYGSKMVHCTSNTRKIENPQTRISLIHYIYVHFYALCGTYHFIPF